MALTTASSFASLHPYFTDYGIFMGMIITAFVVGFTPLKYPFQWLEVYYHELSHGLAALFTGGGVGRIKLNMDGSGWCSTRGGSRFIILIMGYTGAAAWGAWLYFAGWHLGAEENLILLKVELGLLAIVTVLWVRDIITLLITASVAAIFAAPLFIPHVLPFTAWILQFAGIYVMLNAIRAPLHLIDGQHVGDGAMLADLTLIFREWFWISLWFIFGWVALGFCAVKTLPGLDAVWENVVQSLI